MKNLIRAQLQDVPSVIAIQSSGNLRFSLPDFFAVIMISLCAIPSVQADILAGPILNPSTGHQYYLLTSANWTTSEAEALTLGGHLVTINDEAENQWVFNSFAAYDGVDRLLWIGLNDAEHTGDYDWSSGQKVNYLNWNENEPNNPDEEFFVYMYCNNVPPWAQPTTWNNFRDEDSDIDLKIFGVVEIDATVSIPASDLVVFRGIHISGDLSDSFESDDSYLKFNPGVTINSAEAPVWLIFDGTLPNDNPASLEIVM